MPRNARRAVTAELVGAAWLLRYEAMSPTKSIDVTIAENPVPFEMVWERRHLFVRMGRVAQKLLPVTA